MRHGETISPTINSDPPLSEEGVKKINLLGDNLNKKRLKITQIFHSEKLRSKMTAEILASHLMLSPMITEHPKLKPQDPIEPILNEMESLDKDTVIVGHLPFLEKLLFELLINSENSPTFRFQTGSIVCLERSQNDWTLKWTCA